MKLAELEVRLGLESAEATRRILTAPITPLKKPKEAKNA